MRSKDAHSARAAWLVIAGLIAFMLLLAGCGSNSNGNAKQLQKVGEGEGEVDLIAPGNYTVSERITARFEHKTGCEVNSKPPTSPDEMLRLMRSGQYDGVAALGNATGRLVDDGDVAPVNVSLVPNYKTIYPELKDQPFNTFEGVHYGIPHSREANLLMWNPNDVKPAPTSWDAIFDSKKAAKYKGKISVYDEPIYIADAAVYLKAHQPDLGIENPYELNEEQFEAAVNLLKEQRPFIGEYWTESFIQAPAFAEGNSQIGATWQFQYLTLTAEKHPVAVSPASQGFLPSEGATGWSATWMISSKAKHLNCMYKWMNWIVSPEGNAASTEVSGEAPAQSLACGHYEIGDFCAKYHANDSAFWKRIYYWETPEADCGNGSTDCMDYDEWVKAWKSIKDEGPS